MKSPVFAICSFISAADNPRLSSISTDFRPRPVTMELVIYSTDCPVCCALSWANSRYLPRSSNGILKSFAILAAFISSRSFTVPLVALRRLSSRSGRSNASNARVTPSAAAAILTPSATRSFMPETMLQSQFVTCVSTFPARVAHIPLFNMVPPNDFSACLPAFLSSSILERVSVSSFCSLFHSSGCRLREVRFIWLSKSCARLRSCDMERLASPIWFSSRFICSRFAFRVLLFSRSTPFRLRYSSDSFFPAASNWRISFCTPLFASCNSLFTFIRLFISFSAAEASRVSIHLIWSSVSRDAIQVLFYGKSTHGYRGCKGQVGLIRNEVRISLRVFR